MATIFSNVLNLRLNDYGYTILTVANTTHMHIQQLSISKGESIVDEFWLSKDKGFVATDESRSVCFV